MTNKCRRRMNGGEGYITTETSQSRGDGKQKEKEKMLGTRRLGGERSWEFTSLDEESFLLGT